jgi:hypothetical protein
MTGSFPVAVLARLLTKTIRLGHLYPATRFRQCAISPSSVSAGSLATINAATSSPHFSSGVPMTAPGAPRQPVVTGSESSLMPNTCRSRPAAVSHFVYQQVSGCFCG